MTLSNLPPLVTVFGGSGFVGRHVVRALAKRGYRIRVAVRRPDLAGFLQPLGNVGQISFVQANLRYRSSVDAAVQGADHVVNCVGILFESGRNGFDAVQDFGARAVAEAARSVGATLTHVSAIGADAKSDSVYAATKGRAEAAVQSILPDAIILRPSIVFGPEDGFFNKFAAMARIAPALPLVGGGKTKFQPVYVGDVAEAVARAVSLREAAGRTFELGGPAVMTFEDLLKLVLRETYRPSRGLVPLPFFAAKMIGGMAQLSTMVCIPPVLTRDQVVLLETDNVVDEGAEGLAELGIEPTGVEAIAASYLWRYRKGGQFASAPVKTTPV